jgi:hypothetical protein
MSDMPSSSVESLVASASGELARLVGDLVERLRDQHAQDKEAALAQVRREAEDAIRLVREEEEASRERAVGEAVSLAGRQFAETESALRAQAEAASAESLASRAGEREQRLAAMERLLRGIVRLDEASSLLGALDALSEAAATEAPRSAVFVVRGDGLRAWRTSGVAGMADDPASLVLDLSQAGPLGDAVRTRQPVAVHPDSFAGEGARVLSPLAIGGHQAGLAVPVVVDGQAVALVYADDGETSDREVPACWPEAVQVLARHAARCLESITARRATAVHAVASAATSAPPREELPMAADAESARRFARLLVSELKLYHEAAVEAGRHARDLRSRLAGPIARARQQYEARVPATLPGRDDYFEQELVRTLAEGVPEVLGARGLAGA